MDLSCTLQLRINSAISVYFFVGLGIGVWRRRIRDRKKWKTYDKGQEQEVVLAP
jgi:hypothetical protein